MKKKKSDRKGLEELMELAKESYPSAKKIARQISVEQLNLEYLINCQKSEDERIRNLAEILLRRLPPKQLNLRYLISCDKSGSRRVRRMAARLALSNFPNQLSPEYLFGCYRLGPLVRVLLNKVMKTVLASSPNQFSLEHLVKINKIFYNSDVREIAFNLALRFPVDQLDIDFIANYRATCQSKKRKNWWSSDCRLVGTLIEKYERADLGQKERDFINRHFTR